MTLNKFKSHIRKALEPKPSKNVII